MKDDWDKMHGFLNLVLFLRTPVEASFHTLSQ